MYEGGIPVFIYTECDTWNMNPVALEKAFEIFPDVKAIVVAHLYGTPGKIDEIKKIATAHGAVIVEDVGNPWVLHIKEKKLAALVITAASVSMETKLLPVRPVECSSLIPRRMPRRYASGQPKAGKQHRGISMRSWAITTA